MVPTEIYIDLVHFYGYRKINYYNRPNFVIDKGICIYVGHSNVIRYPSTFCGFYMCKNKVVFQKIIIFATTVRASIIGTLINITPSQTRRKE